MNAQCEKPLATASEHSQVSNWHSFDIFRKGQVRTIRVVCGFTVLYLRELCCRLEVDPELRKTEIAGVRDSILLDPSLMLATMLQVLFLTISRNSWVTRPVFIKDIACRKQVFQ